jgi:basic membrane protein A
VTCGITAGCMGIAPVGPRVPQAVKDLVTAKLSEIDAGTLIVFAGPIVDQNGIAVVPQGDVLTPDKMSGVDWFVKGIVGSPK